ncbi:MAG: DUF1761 domain-containing protein [bacterium]
MDVLKVDYPSVILAAIAGIAFCMIWYSEKFGLRVEEMNIPKQGYIFLTLTSLVSSLILAIFIKLSGNPGIVGSTVIGAYTGIGLVCPAVIKDSIFESNPLKSCLGASSRHIICYSIMGAIIGMGN